VTIGANPQDVKNGQARIVNFSAKLEELLSEMRENRQPDSAFLFPSPRRGEEDKPARSLRESLRVVREKVGLPDLGFHHLRDFFASQCIMRAI
jgi:integrase